MIVAAIHRAGGIAILDRKAVKAQYLDCLAARTSSALTLQEVIQRLLRLGVARATLYHWGLAAGYRPAAVRSLLSRVFCALGRRERKAGAGRKPSAEALVLLAYSRREYGSRALRLLRAAYRAGKSQAAAHEHGANRANSLRDLIPVPELAASRPIMGPQLEATARESCGAKRAHTNRQQGRLPRLGDRNSSEPL